jgi:hypothetical protein
MILGLQLTAIIFALVMIYFAVIHYKKGQLNGLEILSWITIWVLTILAVAFPEILRTYAKAFAVSRLFDLLVVGGFVLVISVVSSAYIRTKRLERKLEELIRKEALKKIKVKTTKH